MSTYALSRDLSILPIAGICAALYRLNHLQNGVNQIVL